MEYKVYDTQSAEGKEMHPFLISLDNLETSLDLI
jgi:hypothetical protein